MPDPLSCVLLVLGLVSALDTVFLDTSTTVSRLQDSSKGFAASAKVIGDFNGDGIDDWCVSDTRYPYISSDEYGNGAVYLIYGDNSGVSYLFNSSLSPAETIQGHPGIGLVITPDSEVSDASLQQFFGSSIAAVGDFNGDGLADVAIGAPYITTTTAERFQGGVYLVFGMSNASVTGISVADLSPSTGMFIKGPDGGTMLGSFLHRIGNVGDVNCDCLDDLVISATGYPSIDIGSAWVIYGTVTPSNIDLASFNSSTLGFVVVGGNFVGSSVSGLGDVNGDYCDDLIVTTLSSEPENSGTTAVIVFGNATHEDITFASFSTDDSVGVRLVIPITSGLMFRGASAGDLNADGLQDIAVADPGSETVHVVYGRKAGWTDISTGNFTILGTGNSDLGLTIGASMDVDHDGFKDLILTTMTNSGDEVATFIIFSSNDFSMASSFGVLDLDGLRLSFADESVSNNAGFDFSSGDINNDSYTDLLIASYVIDRSSQTLYVLSGVPPTSAPTTSPTTSPTATPTDFIIEESSSTFAVALDGVGDFNGDGVDDFIISDNEASTDGVVYLVYGNSTGLSNDLSGNLETALIAGSGHLGFVVYPDTSIRFRSSTKMRFGTTVAGIGDYNADGLTDIAIGVPYASPAGRILSGAVYVLFGFSDILSSASITMNVTDPSMGFLITSATSFDFLGQYRSALHGAGDVNCDGLPDILVSSSAYPTNSLTGGTWVVYGTEAPGSVDLLNIHNGTGFQVTGIPDAYDRYGFTSAAIGDVNGDQCADIMITTGYDGTALVNMVVIFGGKSKDSPILLESFESGPNTGFQLDFGLSDASESIAGSAGDLNGDGIMDMALGNHRNDGQVFIIFGGEQVWNTSTADVTITGASLSMLGVSVDTAGDVNGDGFSDLYIGDDVGHGYVLYSGTPLDKVSYSLAEFQAIAGMSLSDTNNLGYAVGVADLNNDTADDLLLSSYDKGRSFQRVTIVYGVPASPTTSPSHFPTFSPSTLPTTFPSLTPSVSPSLPPSWTPSVSPSSSPTLSPSSAPSSSPSPAPSVSPSVSPSVLPSAYPTAYPSKAPTNSPTVSPTSTTTDGDVIGVDASSSGLPLNTRRYLFLTAYAVGIVAVVGHMQYVRYRLRLKGVDKLLRDY